MMKALFGWRATTLGMLIAALAATPALADHPTSAAKVKVQPPAGPGKAKQGTSAGAAQGSATGKAKGKTPVDTSWCAQASFSQAFAPFGDFGFYTLIPGQSVNAFLGTGWTLTGGASIVNVTLANGTTGPVLNVPSGSSAISPPMCVSSDYPTGRTMIRDVSGHSGVQFYVSYEGTKTWVKPRTTGRVRGNSTAWTISPRFDLHPYHTTGWQIVRFRLSAGPHPGDYQLYNIYVDPHMHL